MTPPIVFLDTETDGVHPDRKVWEVGMIHRVPGGYEKSVSFMVDIDLSTADPFGLRVGRFYDRHPLGRWLSNQDHSDRPEPDETPDYYSEQRAAERVVRWTHGAHIVGAVPNFDTEVLAPLIRDWEYTPSWHYHLIDVESLMVGYLNGQGRGAEIELPWDSDHLWSACGLPPMREQDKHTALGDARQVQRAYDIIMAGPPR